MIPARTTRFRLLPVRPQVSPTAGPQPKALCEILFNGAGEVADLHQCRAIDVLAKQPWSFAMSNISAKLAIALLLAFASPAASFARVAGAAGSGNLPISGIAPGPANVGGMNNVTVDPSGIGNAAKVAPLPQPHITVPTIPQFK
jgi:hypothetical protein